MFFTWILQNFYEHLLTEHLRMTAPCVYLRILRSFSEHLFYRAPYFMYKLQNFNHQIQSETISQVLFNHFIQGRQVAIRKR